LKPGYIWGPNLSPKDSIFSICLGHSYHVVLAKRGMLSFEIQCHGLLCVTLFRPILINVWLMFRVGQNRIYAP